MPAAAKNNFRTTRGPPPRGRRRHLTHHGRPLLAPTPLRPAGGTGTRHARGPRRQMGAAVRRSDARARIRGREWRDPRP